MKCACESFSQTAVQLLVILFVVSLCSVSVSCGRTKSRTPETVPKAAPVQAKHVSRSIDEIIAEVDAYQPPKGVDTARFERVRAELKRLLLQKKNGKSPSKAPTGSENAVSDLWAFSNNPYTSAGVHWTEKLRGDYNDDGLVGIADLVPITTYFLENTDNPPDDSHKLVVGDSNPEINLQDIPAINDHYDQHIAGYQVFRGHWNGTSIDWESGFRPNPNPANPNWSCDRPTPQFNASSRPAYSYADDVSSFQQQDLPNLRYMVIPYDDNAGQSGGPLTQSNVATLAVQTFTVSGYVKDDSDTTPVEGVTVSLFTTADPQDPELVPVSGNPATTDQNGYYHIDGIPNGEYILSPWSPNFYSFNPAQRVCNVMGGNVQEPDFTERTGLYTVSGWIHDYYTGVGLANVTITLELQNGLKRQGGTDSSGNFSFTFVPSGRYRIDVEKPGYWFGASDIQVFLIDYGNEGSVNWYGYSSLGGTKWPKFHANMQNTGHTTFTGPQTAPTVQWLRPTAGTISSSPAVGADGTIYIGGSTDGGNGRAAYAVDPSNGNILHQFATGAFIASSPAIAGDGTIYVADWNGNLYALNPDFSVKWSHYLGATTESSATIGLDGTIYIGDKGNTFYALYPQNGNVKWAFTVGWFNGAWGCAAISPDYSTVYIAGQLGYVYAIDAQQGTQLWSSRPAAASTRSEIAVDNNTLYVAYQGTNGLYALDASTGFTKWSRTDLPTQSAYVCVSPAVGSNGTVYMGCIDSRLYALNPVDGSTKWYYATDGAIGCSAAVGGDETVYFGNLSGHLYALDGLSGTLKWMWPPGQSGLPYVGFLSSPAISVVNVSGSPQPRLYIGEWLSTNSGGVLAIDPP